MEMDWSFLDPPHHYHFVVRCPRDVSEGITPITRHLLIKEEFYNYTPDICFAAAEILLTNHGYQVSRRKPAILWVCETVVLSNLTFSHSLCYGIGLAQ